MAFTSSTHKSQKASMNIGTLLKLRPVSPESCDTLSKFRKPSEKFPNTVFGVEIELERTTNIRALGAFLPKEDGSLRNNGMEYVSLPWPYEWLVEELNKFYKENSISEVNVSERCSVHVHLNCQQLTIPQVHCLLKLYQVLEQVLFQWIGADRNTSIFCVPISETMIHNKVIKSDPAAFLGIIRRWQKYTAFNLIPLLSLGTVEFRHMSGQATPEKIIQWLAIIGSMYEFVLKNTNEMFDAFLMQLNSSSQYQVLIEKVFGEHSKLFNGYDFQHLMENGVLNMKFMMLSSKEEEKPTMAQVQAMFFNEAITGFRPVPVNFAEDPRPAEF